MKSIYYGELVNFINSENINIENKKIRKGLDELNFKNYPINHGLIQSNLNSLKDIATLDKVVLEYPMGDGIKMILFNLIMQAKGLLHNRQPELDIEIKTNIKLGREFAVCLYIEEYPNMFSKIKISNCRKFELTGNPSKLTKQVAKQIECKFDLLSNLTI